MNDLFVNQLQDIYYAEKRIVGALPEMISKATSARLRSALEARRGETRNRVRTLETVFNTLGMEAKSVTCPAIDGIIEEADDVAGEVDDKNVLDAAPIAAAHPSSITRSPSTPARSPGRGLWRATTAPSWLTRWSKRSLPALAGRSLFAAFRGREGPVPFAYAGARKDRTMSVGKS
jgi:hypothetical protein